jgi:hypothetical protein
VLASRTDRRVVGSIRAEKMMAMVLQRVEASLEPATAVQ